MRPFRALLAFVFAVLMGGAGAQDTLLLCRMEQRTHMTCCCKRAGAQLARDLSAAAAGAVHAAARADAIGAAPCCAEIALQTASVPPSSGTVGHAALVAPLLLLRQAPPAPLLAFATVAAPVRELEPRTATGPPLHIWHHALLL